MLVSQLILCVARRQIMYVCAFLNVNLTTSTFIATTSVRFYFSVLLHALAQTHNMRRFIAIGRHLQVAETQRASTVGRTRAGDSSGFHTSTSNVALIDVPHLRHAQGIYFKVYTGFAVNIKKRFLMKIFLICIR